MPTELIDLIANDLSLPDLQNFRRANRWAENEVFLVFARQQYR